MALESDRGVIASNSWQSAPVPQDRSELRNTIEVDPLNVTFGGTSPLGPYGTRLSTVVLVRRNGQVLFIERDIWQLNEAGDPVRADPRSERSFQFVLQL